MNSAKMVSRPSDRFIPWLFVVFFAVIAVMDGIFVTLAVRTHTGTVSDHAYEEGLAYNTAIESAGRQANTGWVGTMNLSGQDLTFVFKDKKGDPLSGAVVEALAMRPVQEGHDFEITLTEQESGVYAAPVLFPLPGEWTVRIFAQWQGTPYQQSKTFVRP